MPCMRSCAVTAAVLAVVVAAAVVAPAAATTVRGVAPEQAEVFARAKADGRFTCLDGSDTIEFTEVNDDYCDCADESDEPGTAACTNAQFWCANSGFEGVAIPSSRVNDGLCDCCDGSDEWSVPSLCRNRCDVLQEERAKALQEQASSAIEGLRLRRMWAEDGRLEAVHKAKLQAIYEKKVKKYERKADELTEVRKHWEDVAARRKNAEDAPETKDEDEEEEGTAAVVEQDQDPTGDDDDVAKDSDVDVETDGGGDDGEEDGDEDEEEDEDEGDDRARRRRERRRRMKEKRKKKKKNNKDGAAWKPSFSLIPDEEPEEFSDAARSVMSPLSDVLYRVRRFFTRWSRHLMLMLGRVPRLFKSELERARAEEQEAKDEAARIRKELEQVTAWLKTDFGSDYQYHKLYDKCLTYKKGEGADAKYTYDVCFFQDVSQRGSTSHNLGKWVGWSDDTYTAMMFENGDKCWQGPKRSVRVDLRCGGDNRIVSFDEPDVCVYVAVLETPAACEEEQVAKLAKQAGLLLNDGDADASASDQ